MKMCFWSLHFFYKLQHKTQEFGTFQSPSIFFLPLIHSQVVETTCPGVKLRHPSSSYNLQLLWEDNKDFPGQREYIYNPSCELCPGVSSQQDMPGKPTEGSSDSDAWKQRLQFPQEDGAHYLISKGELTEEEISSLTVFFTL